MTSRVSINITKGMFSNLAVVRKQIYGNHLNGKLLSVDIDKCKFQKSGIALAVGAIALMVFSKFLSPFFSLMALITGFTLLSASTISSLREVLKKSSQIELFALLRRFSHQN